MSTMYTKNILILTLCFFLIAWVSCQASESNNVTSAEESTADVIKTVRKRYSLTNNNNPEEEQNTQQPAGGLNPLLIQIVGNLFKNAVNKTGLNTKNIGSAINFFNINKIKENLLLFRRGLNLVGRYAVFFNKYLPSPSGETSNSPFKFLSGKVRFYSTNPDSFRWLDSNQDDSATVAPHIQNIVDFATQKEDSFAASVSDELEEIVIPEDDITTATTAPTTTTTTTTTERAVVETTPTVISSSSVPSSAIPTSTISSTTPKAAPVILNLYPIPSSQNVTGNGTGNGTANDTTVRPTDLRLPFRDDVPDFHLNNYGFNYNRPIRPPPSYNSFFNSPANRYDVSTNTYVPAFFGNPGVNPYHPSGFFGWPGYPNNIPYEQNYFNPNIPRSYPNIPNSRSVADLPLAYSTVPGAVGGQLRDSFGNPINTNEEALTKGNKPSFPSK